MFLDLLKQELGQSKPASGQERYCCPFCNESKYKFYINTTEGHKHKDLWICFKCGEKGNPVSFVKEYYGVSYMDAVDILATFDYDVNDNNKGASLKQYGNDLSEEEQLLLFISRGGQPLEEESNQVLKFPPPPTNCKTLISNFNNPEAFPFFQYLHGRGITLEQIKKHNISYVTRGNVQLTDGRQMDLVNHLVFYTFNSNGKPVYWNTRSIDPNPFIKSLNGIAKEGEYSKLNTVFNLNNAKYEDKIVIVESVFNSLTIGPSAVASFGKQVADEQLDLILRETEEKKQPIYLFLDTDAWKSMIKVANRIYKKDSNREVYYVYTGEPFDANDLGHDRSWEAINNAHPANSNSELLMQLDNL